MKKQVVIIHGGDTHGNYEEYLEFLKNYKVSFERHALRQEDFQMNLQKDLGEEYQVIRPEMPNKRDAKYLEWKIWFEKMFQFMDDEVVLVGSSMGALFLAKYLSENTFPKKIKALFLIAAPSGNNPPHYNLWTFTLPASLSKIAEQTDKVYLYHSKDDNVVPFANLADYQQQLPNAITRVFEDRGHFNQPALPELLEDIRAL